MSKTVKSKPVKKPVKQKLSPAERSQIAIDRWAKIKAAKEAAAKEAPEGQDAPQEATLVAPPVVELTFKQEPVTQENPIEASPAALPLEPPAAPPQAPVSPKKPKRIPQPKEFSSALKAAESRLAKAIQERAEFMGKLAGLNAEIPSLMGIIQALKGSGNYASPAPFDFSGSVPNAAAFQAPLPQYPAYQTPLDALAAAQPAPPVSRAHGGVQFTPDMVGTLEGPEDDDEDRFLRGGGVATEGKWV